MFTPSVLERSLGLSEVSPQTGKVPLTVKRVLHCILAPSFTRAETHVGLSKVYPPFLFSSEFLRCFQTWHYQNAPKDPAEVPKSGQTRQT